MEKKKIIKLASIIVGLLIVVLIGGMAMSIIQKNKEIATLKEKISQSQSDRFMDLLRFGQWKLKVEELAEKNGWQLPEMSDSLVLTVEGPEQKYIVKELGTVLAPGWALDHTASSESERKRKSL